MERFGTEKDIDFYVANATNANTQRCTDKWVNCFKEWATSKKKDHEIEKLAPFELDLRLQNFFTEVRKRDGTEYEPNSLASLQAGIDRYLKLKGYKYSILKHQYFSRSRTFWTKRTSRTSWHENGGFHITNQRMQYRVPYICGGHH